MFCDVQARCDLTRKLEEVNAHMDQQVSPAVSSTVSIPL